MQCNIIVRRHEDLEGRNTHKKQHSMACEVNSMHTVCAILATSQSIVAGLAQVIDSQMIHGVPDKYNELVTRWNYAMHVLSHPRLPQTIVKISKMSSILDNVQLRDSCHITGADHEVHIPWSGDEMVPCLLSRCVSIGAYNNKYSVFSLSRSRAVWCGPEALI